MDIANRFDIQKFNDAFEKSKELNKAKSQSVEQATLSKMNKEERVKSITELTVSEILIGIKDSWFDLIDDLLQRRFNLTTFTKNNRLFYIGLTIVIIVLIIYLYDLIVDEEEPTDKKIVEIHYIHKIDNTNGANNQLYKLSQMNDNRPSDTVSTKMIDKMVTDMILSEKPN